MFHRDYFRIVIKSEKSEKSRVRGGRPDLMGVMDFEFWGADL